MNKENLLKLSDFLMKNEVPFDMESWRSTRVENDDGNMEKITKSLTLDEIDAGVNQCGTAGCAAGWAPFVIPPSEKCIIDLGITKGGRVHFITYIKEAFDLTVRQYDSVFDAFWVNADNSREGAAFRLAALAQNGEVFDPLDIRWSRTARDAYLQARHEWVTKWEQANENK